MNTTSPKKTKDDEEIFIQDECGDTLWDAVLVQPHLNQTVREEQSAKDPKRNSKPKN